MKITVYSTRTCPYCFELKDWFKENKIKFSEISIDVEPILAKKKLTELDWQGIVPFTVIEYEDGRLQKISGPDYKKFKKIFQKD